MNPKSFLSAILIILGISTGYPQQDTLINYNTITGEIYNYPPVVIDTSIIFDNTNWNYGSLGGRVMLDLDPPDTTYNNSGFTDFIPAQDLFSVDSYPVRTAVKLFIVKNDSLFQRCSGILVAPDYVLTCFHCIADYDTNTSRPAFYDSVKVYPAFDNGEENTQFGNSIGIEYVTFRSNLYPYYQKDIALMKLKDSIGIKTGWTGIAFSKDNRFYENNVFHKLSYPGMPDPSDTTRIFNGDTLYYNYGILDWVGETWLGYNITGIPGQSGSTLLYTDNEKYYVVGNMMFSYLSRHFRISPEAFYGFRPIINNGVLDIKNDKELISDFKLYEAYPNPFNPSSHIRFQISERGPVTLKVYDVLGNEISTLVNGEKPAGTYTVKFDGSNLSSGVYIYRLTAGKYISSKKFILVK